MRELDSLVMSSKTDQKVFDDLIRQNEYTILKYSSRITGRYITKKDDEWSIALFAFSQAMKTYELEKGSFISFAQLLIKRRLIDYSKSQGKFKPEVFVDPIVFDTEPEEEEEDLSIRISVADKVATQESDDLKLEIEAANQTFLEYGFTFFDLTDCSPHAKKTKTCCAKAVGYMLENPMLVNELRTSKQLPLKIIEKYVKVPRKILERHRKYIIAAIEILSGGYPYLAEYLQYIRKENGR